MFQYFWRLGGRTSAQWWHHSLDCSLLTNHCSLITNYCSLLTGLCSQVCRKSRFFWEPCLQGAEQVPMFQYFWNSDGSLPTAHCSLIYSFAIKPHQYQSLPMSHVSEIMHIIHPIIFQVISLILLFYEDTMTPLCKIHYDKYKYPPYHEV